MPRRCRHRLPYRHPLRQSAQPVARCDGDANDVGLRVAAIRCAPGIGIWAASYHRCWPQGRPHIIGVISSTLSPYSTLRRAPCSPRSCAGATAPRRYRRERTRVFGPNRPISRRVRRQTAVRTTLWEPAQLLLQPRDQRKNPWKPTVSALIGDHEGSLCHLSVLRRPPLGTNRRLSLPTSLRLPRKSLCP